MVPMTLDGSGTGDKGAAMMRLWQLWRQRPVLTSAFLLACAVTLFFAGASSVTAPSTGRTTSEEPVSAWMTVGYVGRSWGLDPREIDAVAGLPLPEVKGHPQTLAEIAARPRRAGDRHHRRGRGRHRHPARRKGAGGWATE